MCAARCSAARENSTWRLPVTLDPTLSGREFCRCRAQRSLIALRHASLDPLYNLVVARLTEAAIVSCFSPRPPRETGRPFQLKRTLRPSPAIKAQRGTAMQPTSYVTKGGLRITREIRSRAYEPADTTL